MQISAYRIILIGLLMLSSCDILQDNYPMPKNYSPTTDQIMNTTILNETINQTQNISVEPLKPPEPVLVPVDGLGIYILDTTLKGTSIITLNNHSILINAQGGSESLRILRTLKNLGYNNIDYLILTNNDEGNIGGVPYIILRVPPDNIYYNGISSTSTSYASFQLLFPNATIVSHDNVIGFQDSIINLQVPYDDGNSITDDNSIVPRIDYGDFSAVFLTDCKLDCETRISLSYADVIVSNGDCDSLSLGTIKKINPQLVVFSGTPCKELSDRFTNLGIPYIDTTVSGDIIIKSNGLNYSYVNLKVTSSH